MTDAQANETQEEFKARIEAAFQSPGKKDVRSLFHLTGHQSEMMIVMMISQLNAPQISFAELPEDFDPVQIAGGFKYSPSLDPVGHVIFEENEEKTEAPYGVHEGKFYFTGIKQTPVE